MYAALAQVDKFKKKKRISQAVKNLLRSQDVCKLAVVTFKTV